MSKHYPDPCHQSEGDAARDQLDWFAAELLGCKARKQKALIVCHDPLGVDVFGVLHGKSDRAAENVTDFLRPIFVDALIKLYTEWQETILMVFSGHTHMDEFRLVMNHDDTPAVAINVTPSISPIFGNNPGFQVISTCSEGTIQDYTTWYYDLNRQNGWRPSYTFSDVYGFSGIDPQSMLACRNAIKHDPIIQKAYIQHFSVKETAHSQLHSDNWSAFFHAITELEPEAYIRSYCQPDSDQD